MKSCSVYIGSVISFCKVDTSIYSLTKMSFYTELYVVGEDFSCFSHKHLAGADNITNVKTCFPLKDTHSESNNNT